MGHNVLTQANSSILNRHDLQGNLYLVSYKAV
jgi:hypothetical protein